MYFSTISLNWLVILHMHCQEADIFIKLIIMHANIKLLDLLTCFHYILSPLVLSIVVSFYYKYNLQSKAGKMIET